MQELRKSQPSLSPPGSPCLDQPSGKFLSFLAGLGTVDSIHWAAGSAGTRAVVSLAHRYIPSTPAARSWADAGRCRRTGARLGTQIPGVPWRRRARGGRGAAKREAVGRLLLGRRVRPVCLVHVLWTGVYARRCHSRGSVPVQIFCISTR